MQSEWQMGLIQVSNEKEAEEGNTHSLCIGKAE